MAASQDEEIAAKKVLLGFTGSVATIKGGELVEYLRRAGFIVQCVCTESAAHFLKGQWALPAEVRCFRDADEWAEYTDLGDPVLHIDLRNWADVLLIAPLDANTMGKLTTGLCDNLLTCIARAWDFQKPFIVAPAMNTYMWNHPLTTEHLRKLDDLGISVVLPVEKKLACGDVGIGAMERSQIIVQQVVARLQGGITGGCPTMPTTPSTTTTTTTATTPTTTSVIVKPSTSEAE